jgi:putative ATP-dependent endonuclease of OLD family
MVVTQGESMYLRRVVVRGFRSAADSDNGVTCTFPGRFSLLIGSNNAGKTTITDALYLAHEVTFPQLRRPSVAVLGRPPREVEVEYAFSPDGQPESPLGRCFRDEDGAPPRLVRELARNLGQIRSSPVGSVPRRARDLRLVYLPAHRNPVDELARREADILVGLLRAEQLRVRGHRNLLDIRTRAARLLHDLSTDPLIESVEQRVREHLTALSAGVSPHYSFVGGQSVDDAYLARVLELLLGTVDDRALAQRLEMAGLGYVNLLHIAVTLAAIPDTTGQGGTVGTGASPNGEVPPNGSSGRDAGHGNPAAAGSPDGAERADRRLEQTEAEAASEQDAFYPNEFHVTVVIEEPEAHLHPQLQYGLARYLRRVTAERPEIQVIISSHAGEIIAACDPAQVVVMRKDAGGRRRAIAVGEIPLANRDRTLRMAELHLDATRSGALFAERAVLVEGVTDAVVLRQLGAVWAGDDQLKRGFIDALTITVMGTKVGEWAVDLLATPGHEIVQRIAILRDSDTRGGPPPELPAWITSRDPVVRAFVSHPTLEPSLVERNEDAIVAALATMNLTPKVPVTAELIDTAFQGNTGRKRKGEFALELAGAFAVRHTAEQPVHVPAHIEELFEFLYGGPGDADVAEDDTAEHAGVGDAVPPF